MPMPILAPVLRPPDEPSVVVEPGPTGLGEVELELEVPDVFGPVVAVVPVDDWPAVAVADVEEAEAAVDWKQSTVS